MKVEVETVGPSGKPRKFVAWRQPTKEAWFVEAYRQVESDDLDGPGWAWMIDEDDGWLPDELVRTLAGGETE